MEEPKIYNSRIIDAYLKLIRAKYTHVNISTLLQQSGMESYEVADQGTWFTQTQVNDFYAAVVQATGNPEIALEAGRYAASPDALGTMRKYTLALLGPSTAFSILGRLTDNLTKSTDFKTRQIDTNSVEVIVKSRIGVKEQPFQCQNRIGFFEAIVSVFSIKPPKIEHPECLFKGGDECRYTIRWVSEPTARYKLLRDIMAVVLSILVLLSITFSSYVVETILAATAIFFVLNYLLELSRRLHLDNTFKQLRDSTDQLTEQISTNYRNVQLTREIGEVVISQNNIDDVVSAVVRILEKTLDFDRGLILLADESKKILEIRGAFGYSREHLFLLERTTFRLDNTSSQGPFVVSFRDLKPLLINDINEINITSKSRQFIEALGIQSFLSVPILSDNKSIGILAVDNHQKKRPLLNTDLNVLMSIAPTIGVSFRNASLNEARENQFAATLKVLAQSIDARDFLTAGHSEKVAEYALAIATRMGKSHDYCQMIRTASLLHDYGKIGIPDTVLKKNGPLTTDERSLIQTHSKKSYDILSQVPFDGIFEEIPKIALHHHERWDGTGYPEGLDGQKIPLGARIVAVADFYEAVTSKRHYREPMQTQEAIDLLCSGKGSHFDSSIVDIFLSCLNYQSQPDESIPTVSLPQKIFNY